MSGSLLKKWSLFERVYVIVCVKVYDIWEYKREEMGWGLFYMFEGEEGKGLRVDWEKVEVIMIVLGMNLWVKGLVFFDVVEYVWGKRFGGVWEGSYIFWVLENVFVSLEDKKVEGEEEEEEEWEKRLELEEIVKRDLYGVKGIWLRVVCFFDYMDFFYFNFYNYEGEG